MAILVSVPVITYNAADFIEETLESIFNQTHDKIDLIIADDCSKDTTLQLVENWCSQPRVKQRFVSIKIITVPKNTGITANYNRGVKACEGARLKCDLLPRGTVSSGIAASLPMHLPTPCRSWHSFRESHPIGPIRYTQSSHHALQHQPAVGDVHDLRAVR